MQKDISLEEVEAAIREVWNSYSGHEVSERSREILRYIAKCLDEKEKKNAGED